MQNRKKHKRIFYVPGMISLMLLPLICLFYFYENKSFDEYRAFNLSLPNERTFEEVKTKYGSRINRNYKEFVFNNSEIIEKDKLKEMQLSLRELKKTNDTLNGVEIHLGKKATYAVFIRIIDIVSIEEDMPTWFLDKNDIRILMPKKYKPKVNKEEYHRVNCGTQDIMWAEAGRIEEIKKEKEKQEFEDSFFKDMLPIFLAYFGIVILNIFALVKFNKNRKFNQKTYI